MKQVCRKTLDTGVSLELKRREYCTNNQPTISNYVDPYPYLANKLSRAVLSTILRTAWRLKQAGRRMTLATEEPRRLYPKDKFEKIIETSTTLTVQAICLQTLGGSTPDGNPVLVHNCSFGYRPEEKIADKWYHFNEEEGAMKTGRSSTRIIWYYLDAKGCYEYQRLYPVSGRIRLLTKPDGTLA